MMPVGLTKFLTRGELLDLVRFVSELGKPGAYAVRPQATIQRWRVLAQPPAELTADVPHLEHLRAFVLNAPAEQWRSVYGTVSGVLPLNELRAAREPTVVILVGEVQVNEPGRVEVEITCTERTQVWVDEASFENQRRFETELAQGRHQIVVRVEISGQENPELKLELIRPVGSTVQLEVIGGQ